MREVYSGAVADRIPDRQDAMGRGGLRGREMLRLESDRHVEEVAPACQLLQAVGLSLGRALGQGQASRSGEHRREVNGMDADRRSASRRDVEKARSSEMGPGRIQRSVVIDPETHLS